jgi:hypothetical protein
MIAHLTPRLVIAMQEANIAGQTHQNDWDNLIRALERVSSNAAPDIERKAQSLSLANLQSLT